MIKTHVIFVSAYEILAALDALKILEVDDPDAPILRDTRASATVRMLWSIGKSSW